MTDYQGFLSYEHEDDQAEGQRISRLGRDIADQFEILTDDKVDLFIDRDAIEWGENWRDRIDESLASIAFFIPVMTPRYFMSKECRRELRIFAQQATKLGIRDLILPILYVDVPSIHDDSASDDLIALVRTFHWEDWRELRFADIGSEEYRRGVARLATRLVEANRQAEQTIVASGVPLIDKTTDGEDDEPLGTLDRMVKAEKTLPEWTETIEAISQDIIEIGQIAEDATAETLRVDAQVKGFGPRLLIARKMARQLGDPVERIWSSGKEFASQLHDVDDGFRAIIEQASTEVEQDPASVANVCKFFEAVRSLSTSMHDGLVGTQKMIDAIEPLEKISRDLRPVIRRLRHGLTIMFEAGEVSDEWVYLIDASGVKCEDQDLQTD